MQRFVGASEETLRAIFEMPPPCVVGEEEDSLHVIVFDELDAVARRRGGGTNDGEGQRGGGHGEG